MPSQSYRATSYRDKINRNSAYARAKRAKWIEDNGPCKKCGSSKDLEIDHIDPKSKSFEIHFALSLKTLEPELVKCQVLCHDCHRKKSNEENSNRHTRIILPMIHGTLKCYWRGCRCDECYFANKEYNKQLHKKKKQNV